MYESLLGDIIKTCSYYLNYTYMLNLKAISKYYYKSINITEWCRNRTYVSDDIGKDLVVTEGLVEFLLIDLIELREWFTVEYVINNYKDINYMKTSIQDDALFDYYTFVNLFARLPFKLLIKVIPYFQQFSLETWQDDILKNSIYMIIRDKQYLVYSCYELCIPFVMLINYPEMWDTFDAAEVWDTSDTVKVRDNNYFLGILRKMISKCKRDSQILWNNNYKFLYDQIINIETYIYTMDNNTADDDGDKYTAIYTLDIYDHIDTRTFFNVILQFEHINYPEFAILRALIRLKRIFERLGDFFNDLYMDPITVQEYDEMTLINIVNYLVTKCDTTSSNIFETIQQFYTQYGYSFNLTLSHMSQENNTFS